MQKEESQQQTNDLFNIIEEVSEVIPESTDDRSKQEKAAIDYYANKDAIRGNREKNATHWIKVVALWVLAISVIIIFLIRIAHFVLPSRWQWISDINLQAIDKYFFSGAVGGALAKYGGNIFNEKKNK